MLAVLNNLSSAASRGRAFTFHMAAENNNQRWAKLMCLAQSGNEKAYEELLTELAPVIERSLLQKFGRFPFLEDCVQESLLAIHQARHTYNPGRPFQPWMNALVKHKTIDFFRSQKRHHHTDAELEADNIARTTEFDMDDYLSGAELLALLDKPNREALVYTKFMGFSIEDTAAKLETTPAAIKQRVKRAIAKTSRLLALSLD